MNTLCAQVPFDSEIFQKHVYKCVLDSRISKQQLTSLLSRKDIDILYCFTIFDNENIKLLESSLFSLVSIRSEYETALEIHPTPVNDKFNITLYSDKTMDKKEYDGMLKTLYKTSRYAKDPSIPHRIGLKVYAKWFENTFHHGYADDVLIALSKTDELLGFVSLKRYNAYGSIDLIVTDEHHQNCGIGTALMAMAQNHLYKLGIRTMKVITEAENIPANRFYQKQGFRLRDLYLVYHKHF